MSESTQNVCETKNSSITNTHKSVTKQIHFKIRQFCVNFRTRKIIKISINLKNVNCYYVLRFIAHLFCTDNFVYFPTHFCAMRTASSARKLHSAFVSVVVRLRARTRAHCALYSLHCVTCALCSNGSETSARARVWCKDARHQT